MKKLTYLFLALLIVASCSKSIDSGLEKIENKIDNPCIYVGVFLLFIFTQKFYNNRYLRQHSD